MRRDRIADKLYQKRKRKLYPELKKEETLKYYKNNPEKVSAVWKVREAIMKGILIRKSCEICGNEKSQGHHENYEKPLEVVWLCPSHHKLRHLAIKGR